MRGRLIKFSGYVVLTNWFQQNIKGDKLSVGQMPTGNTNNQATKQTSWISRYLAAASALHFDLDGNTIQTLSAVKISLGLSQLPFPLYNDLSTHSAATPSVHLEVSGGNFPLSFLRRWCKSDPHWPDILKARLSRTDCNRYDRTRSALVPRVCVLLSALSDLFPQKLLVPSRFN